MFVKLESDQSDLHDTFYEEQLKYAASICSKSLYLITENIDDYQSTFNQMSRHAWHGDTGKQDQIDIDRSIILYRAIESSLDKSGIRILKSRSRKKYYLYVLSDNKQAVSFRVYLDSGNRVVCLKFAKMDNLSRYIALKLQWLTGIRITDDILDTGRIGQIDGNMSISIGQ